MGRLQRCPRKKYEDDYRPKSKKKGKGKSLDMYPIWEKDILRGGERERVTQLGVTFQKEWRQ